MRSGYSFEIKKVIPTYICLALIVLVGVFVALPEINRFPAYIHAWSQSDWYSMAIGFQNNGYDFFHPETLVMNKQFPGGWMVDDGTAVTSVDFPVHVYIVSLLMRLFGSSAPWVFRVWTLTVSLFGLCCLYLVCERITFSVLKSLMVTFFALFSPLYLYYFDSFLPTVPAMSFVFAGVLMYVVYLGSGKSRDWYLTIAFLTLSALMRTSQVVPLVAVFCSEVLRWILKRRDSVFNSRFLITLLLSVVAISGYLMWNAHLRNQYGSLFLNNLKPPRSWTDVCNVFDIIGERWKFRYFSAIQHWTVVVTMALVALTLLLKNSLLNRFQDFKPSPTVEKSKSLRFDFLLFVLIYCLGELLFFVAMMRQYRDHDYYFLDSLFVPIILLFLLIVSYLPTIKGLLKVVPFVLVVLLCGSMWNAAKHGNLERQKGYDRARQCALAFEDSGEWLDEMGVSRDAKILTLFSYPQNTPFLEMGRCGYSVMWFGRDMIEASLGFNYDYIIVEDSIFKRNYSKAEFVLSRLERVAGNGKISLYLLCDSVVNNSPDATLEDRKSNFISNMNNCRE